MGGFRRRRLSRGDNPNDSLGFTIAVTNQKQAQSGTQAQEQKSVFPLRMIVVVELDSLLVEEHRPRLLEGDVVLIKVRLCLLGIPSETHRTHNYIVTTRDRFVNL